MAQIKYPPSQYEALKPNPGHQSEKDKMAALLNRDGPEETAFNQPARHETIAPIALRLKGLEKWSSETKTEAMRSIADDLRTAFMCIAQHVEAGDLSDRHTRPLDTVIEAIRETDVASRRELERKTQRLRRERKCLKQEYRLLKKGIEEVGSLYLGRVKELTRVRRGLLLEMKHLRAEREMLRLQLRAKQKKDMGKEEIGVGCEKENLGVDGELQEEV